MLFPAQYGKSGRKASQYDKREKAVLQEQTGFVRMTKKDFWEIAILNLDPKCLTDFKRQKMDGKSLRSHIW